MIAKIRRWARHYFYGLFAQSWNTSISAVDAFIGLAVGAAVSVDVHAINWKGALAVFATTYVRTALQYFRDNPLPKQLPAGEELGPESFPPLPRPVAVSQPQAFAKIQELP